VTAARQDTADRHRRGSVAARAAGLAFVPLPLIPLVYALATLLDNTPPDPSCFEYCDLGRDFAWFPLVLGLIGVWMAILIWRRHVAAMALALFVTALLSALWAIGFVALVLSAGSITTVHPGVLAVGIALLAADGVLVAALREEMIRAGTNAAANAATAVADAGHSPPA
jgi:hypothetical protein